LTTQELQLKPEGLVEVAVRSLEVEARGVRHNVVVEVEGSREPVKDSNDKVKANTTISEVVEVDVAADSDGEITTSHNEIEILPSSFDLVGL